MYKLIVQLDEFSKTLNSIYIEKEQEKSWDSVTTTYIYEFLMGRTLWGCCQGKLEVSQILREQTVIFWLTAVHFERNIPSMHIGERGKIMSIKNQRRNCESFHEEEGEKDDLPGSQISRNQTCQNIAKNVSNQDFPMNQN